MLDEALLRSLFADAVKRSGAVGAQLSIVKADQELHMAAGFANAARGIVMTTECLMQIGSITKLFNATIVMSLIEDGVLDLDVPLREYLPAFKVADPQTSAFLTLRHLLSMSSGLDNGPYVYSGSGDDALELYVQQLASLPQQFPLGKHFGYSNAGTCIAGHLAARVMGKSWEALLQERILRPAGLNHSAILDEHVQDQVIAVGHKISAEGLKIVEPKFSALRGRAPSGPSFALSIRELVKFGKIFLNRGMTDSGIPLLTASTLKRMVTPQVATPIRMHGTAWCLGPLMGNWNGVKVWGHGGTSNTATSFLYWIPEHHGVIAFSLNTHAAMGEFSRIAFDDILKAAFGFAKPRIDTPDIALGSFDPRRYVGNYEELGMRMEVTAGEGDTLRARWDTKAGAYQSAVIRPERSAILVPLGADRFLVSPLEGPDRHRGVVDTAFFGEDFEGRAMNVLNLLFPMRRI